MTIFTNSCSALLGVLLLCCAATGTAQDKPWVDAAVRFMDEDFAAEASQLGARRGDVLDKMAISPAVTSDRRRELGLQWNGLARAWWQSREINVEALADWQQGKFAAVVVKLSDPDRPLLVQVIGLGLLRQEDGTWQVGPALGSLENMSATLAADPRRSITEGTRWIVREVPKYFASGVDDAKATLFAAIAEEEKVGIISSDDPLAVADRFFDLDDRGKLAGVLAYLGGIDRPLPEDWTDTVEEWSQLMAVRKQQRARGDLSSEAMVTIAVGTLSETRVDAEVVIARYFADDSQLRLYSVPLEREEDHWKILIDDLEELSADDGNIGKGEYEMLLESFPARYTERYGGKGLSSPEQLFEVFQTAVQERRLEMMWDHFAAPDSSGDVGVYFRTLLTDFRKILDPEQNSLDRKYLRTIVVEDAAAMVFGIFDEQEMELSLYSLQLERRNGLWYFSPHLNNLTDSDLIETLAAEEDELRQLALASKLSQIDQLAAFPKAPAPTADVASQLVLEYRQQLSSGLDITQALKLTARLPASVDEDKILQALDYARRGARADGAAGEVLGTSSAGGITGVSYRIETKATQIRSELLYLVVLTDTGPRVLCDIDLRYPRSSARKRLNARVLGQLEKSLEPEQLSQIKTLLDAHLERVKALE